MLGLAARLSLFGALACASAPVEIDAPRDLQGFRTWEWQPVETRPTVPADPVLDARLRDAIARELYARGFRPPRQERADFGVTYQVALKRELVVRTDTHAQQFLPSLHAGTPSYEIVASERRVVRYERFALHVELRDSATGDVVWRADLEDRTRGRFLAKADEAVATLLRELPPRRERI
ncbi:MAG TPA: DUF4136 domain-containing protein [Myxococcota bacterium]|nr:DUF4136 domain-containing protein [Myxococcota bacterium]